MQKFLGKIRNTRRYFVLNKAFGSIQNEITLFDFHVDLSWSTFIKPYWQLPKRKKTYTEKRNENVFWKYQHFRFQCCCTWEKGYQIASAAPAEMHHCSQKGGKFCSLSFLLNSPPSCTSLFPHLILIPSRCNVRQTPISVNVFHCYSRNLWRILIQSGRQITHRWV